MPGCQYPARVNAVSGIQGDTEGFRRIDSLENVHVVGDLDPLLWGIIKQGIPARPDSLTFGQQPDIGVQDHFITLILQHRQSGLLTVIRISQER